MNLEQLSNRKKKPEVSYFRQSSISANTNPNIIERKGLYDDMSYGK